MTRNAAVLCSNGLASRESCGRHRGMDWKAQGGGYVRTDGFATWGQTLRFLGICRRALPQGGEGGSGGWLIRNSEDLGEGCSSRVVGMGGFGSCEGSDGADVLPPTPRMPVRPCAASR